MTYGINFEFIPANNAGKWTPEGQEAARHKGAPYVQVSQAQFFAAIGPSDIVSSAQVATVEKERYYYSQFETRERTPVGRIYPPKHGNSLGPSTFLLNTGYASQVTQRMLNAREAEPTEPETAPAAQEPMAERQRP